MIVNRRTGATIRSHVDRNRSPVFNRLPQEYHINTICESYTKRIPAILITVETFFFRVKVTSVISMIAFIFIRMTYQPNVTLLQYIVWKIVSENVNLRLFRFCSSVFESLIISLRLYWNIKHSCRFISAECIRDKLVRMKTDHGYHVFLHVCPSQPSWLLRNKPSKCPKLNIYRASTIAKGSVWNNDIKILSREHRLMRILD